MIYKISCRLGRLASALRHLCGRAPMHRQTSMYKSLRPGGARPETSRGRPAGLSSNVFSDEIGIPIGFAYDIQPCLLFLPFGFCLTAVECRHHQGAHAWPGANVRIERFQ